VKNNPYKSVLPDTKDVLNLMYRHFDNARAHGFDASGHTTEYAAWLSAWLFLRWVENEDKERQSVAVLDGKEYQPLIPEWLCWESIQRIEPNRIADFLDHRVVPYLLHLDDRPLAVNLKHMAPLFESTRSNLPDILHGLKNLLDPLDFSDPAHAEYAGRLLDDALFTKLHRLRSVEFITPQSIVELMVELAKPQPGERVYDPCFGSGGLLVESARRIKAAAKTRTADDWDWLKSQSIFGMELNPVAYAIAVTRIALAGIPEPGLELGNSLLRQHERSFDIVLANPPWGQIREDSLPQNYYDIQSRDIANLFVQHVMQVLKPGGRAVVAVPEGILFASGSNKKLREYLLRRFKIDGVISLPAGTFAPFTGIKANLILFRHEEPAEAVYFYQVQKLAGTSAKFAGKEEKTPDVARKFLAREVGPYSWETPVVDLLKRNSELIVRKIGDELISKWLDKICTPESSVQKLTLHKVAKVIQGVSYDRRMTSEKRSSDNDVPFIRISDIQQGSIAAPALYIDKTKLRKSFESSFLGSNDIILSLKGTIGKVALVQPTNPFQPAIAANSLAIIRPQEVILPEYLSALLRSTSYQQWLSNNTIGAVMPHLNINALRLMPIPLPSFFVQERVVRESKQRPEAEPLAILAEIIIDKDETKKRTDVADEIDLSTAIANFPKVVTAKDAIARVKEAALMYIVILKLISDTDMLAYWSSNTIDAIKLLETIEKYPKGTALYSILNQALINVRYLDEYIEVSRPLHVDQDVTIYVDKLNAFLINELKNAIDEIKKETAVVADINESTMQIGIDKDIEISLSNPGYLPLIDLNIDVNPDICQRQIVYLGENTSRTLSITLPKQFTPGKFDFSLHWTAKQIDGSEIDGNINLAVEIQSIPEQAHQRDLGPSPYVTGSPIDADRPDMFFGRRDIVETIKRQLPISHQANIILLEGNRRSGKTSILYHLLQSGLLLGWIPVYCNFQRGTGDAQRAGLPTHEIFKLLTTSIFEAVMKSGHSTWFPDIQTPDKKGILLKAEFSRVANQIFCDERAFEIFELYLQSSLRIIAPNRLLLMLDEFDKIQEGIDTRITSPQVPENLRYLLHTYSNISAILSYSKILRKLRDEYWSMLFGLGHRVDVGSLDEQDAKLLVTQPAQGKLFYTDAAQNKIITLCARQPFLIQQLCNHIFDKASESVKKIITDKMVETSSQHVSADNEHFRTLWDHHVGTECRRYILVLCEQLEHGPDPITFALLEIKLREANIFARNLSQQLSDDLTHLKVLDLISMQENGSRYYLTIPLMALWIRQNVDYEDQKRRARQESEEKL
jgi:type I restriction enzyme M protein